MVGNEVFRFFLVENEFKVVNIMYIYIVTCCTTISKQHKQI